MRKYLKITYFIWGALLIPLFLNMVTIFINPSMTSSFTNSMFYLSTIFGLFVGLTIIPFTIFMIIGSIFCIRDKNWKFLILNIAYILATWSLEFYWILTHQV